jgi:hypothetical protein
MRMLLINRSERPLMTVLSKSSAILENWLYSHPNFLNVRDRLDILECLHHGYSTPIIFQSKRSF